MKKPQEFIPAILIFSIIFFWMMPRNEQDISYTIEADTSWVQLKDTSYIYNESDYKIGQIVSPENFHETKPLFGRYYIGKIGAVEFIIKNREILSPFFHEIEYNASDSVFYCSLGASRYKFKEGEYTKKMRIVHERREH